MKKIIFGLLVTFSFNSFAQFSLTCPEMYERTIVAKTIKKNKAQNTAYYLSSAGTALSVSGATVLSGAAYLPAAALLLYSSIDPKEERALNLTEEGSRALRRFTKKMQKKVNKGITEQEIISIIDDGLTSGAFCFEFPKLKDAGDIKRYVRDALEIKYSTLY